MSKEKKSNIEAELMAAENKARLDLIERTTLDNLKYLYQHMDIKIWLTDCGILDDYDNKQIEELKAIVNSYKDFYETNGFKSKDDFLGYVVNTMLNKQDKANEIRKLKAENERLKEELEDWKDGTIVEKLWHLERQLKEKDEQIKALNEHCIGQNVINNQLNKHLKEKDEEIESLTLLLKSKDKADSSGMLVLSRGELALIVHKAKEQSQNQKAKSAINKIKKMFQVRMANSWQIEAFELWDVLNEIEKELTNAD